MKVQTAFALVAGLLAHTAVAQPATSLGELTFGQPQCGDSSLQGISASDCSTAITQLLAENCSGGVCSLPAPTDGAQVADASVLVGRCEVLLASFARKPVTFNEDSVQSAFPSFIAECLSGPAESPGDASLSDTNGDIHLIFFNGVSGGG